MPIDPEADLTFDDLVRMVLVQLALPCAGIELAGAAPGPTDSYLAGSPYLPQDSEWPSDEHGPQHFVGQMNWSKVPALEDYPTAGLLQWFVSADDTYGLTEGDDAGSVGFTVRWWDDLSRPSRLGPSAPPPNGPDTDHPLDLPTATRMTFQPGVSVPSWTQLPGLVQELELWTRWAEERGLDPEDLETHYEELVLTAEFLPDGAVLGSKIGGYPRFAQGDDPRSYGAFPLAEVGAGQLLIELDSEQTGGWGDGGIAHLFGRPEAVARGVLDEVQYHWDAG